MGLVLFNTFINHLDDGAEFILRKLWMTQNWKEWLINQGVVLHPEGPQQEEEMSLQEPHKVQPEEVQSPACGEEQPLAPVVFQRKTQMSSWTLF